MHRKHIAVLRGGPHGYEQSLKTGALILNNLSSDRYHVRDILVSKDGSVHVNGVPSQPSRIFQSLDGVVSSLGGESSDLERQLTAFGIPHTGAGAFSRGLSSRPHMARTHARHIGIHAPEAHVLRTEKNLYKEINALIVSAPFPLLALPLQSERIVRPRVTRHFEELLHAAYDFAEHAPMIFIEPYRSGRYVSIGVIEGFRNERLYVLPPVEISNIGHVAGNESGQVMPVIYPVERIGLPVKRDLMRMARTLHQAFGNRLASLFDFRIGDDGTIDFLYLHASPLFASHGAFPVALEAVGVGVDTFLDHIVDMTLAR